MNLPLSWLKDYMEFDIDAKNYCDAMTMSGSKVEGYEETGGGFTGVVLGKILEVRRHENSDHMFICQVEIAPGEVVQIVTGAPNTVCGFAAVATVGATLPGDITIKKGKLRGEISLGMLCSHEELGLSASQVPGAADDGIIIFPGDMGFAVGTDLNKVLGLSETVVEFEITSNRPDCLSVNGLARETAATFGLDFHLPEVSVKGSGGDVNDYAKVSIEDSGLCSRYTARVVKNVKIAPSPQWMQDRLTACGVRPINNIVDITNYVLLEYNQPMHAFDINFLANHEIIVRRAKEGEKITTLDEVERTLSSDMLVIADPEKAVAVAGVMGGFNSEITDETKTILFESAMFCGPSVRRTAQRLGLRTEASARYEKGLDAQNTYPAVMRACQLVELLGAGDVIDGVIDVDFSDKTPRRIGFDPAWINGFLGAEIDGAFMEKALMSLGFAIDANSVVVPSWRADVEGPADVAEEVARLYGYNKIKSTLLRGETTLGVKTPKQKMKDQVLDALASQGYFEVMTYSFTSPKHLAATGADPQKAIALQNPLGEENSVMRTNMLSSILEILAQNYAHRNENVKIFELGTTYIADSLPLAKLPKEEAVLALGAYGNVDYFDVKGALEELFSGLGISNYEFRASQNEAAYHPGVCADVIIGGKKAGVVGKIHPDVLERFEIETDAFGAELDFNALFAAADFTRAYQPLAKFPAVSRDLAVLVDDSVPAADIEKIIKSRSGKLLESLELFDVYKGKQIPEGKKSVAYRAYYRAADRTLTDEDTSKIMNKIIKCLEMELGGELR